MYASSTRLTFFNRFPDEQVYEFIIQSVGAEEVVHVFRDHLIYGIQNLMNKNMKVLKNQDNV